MKFALLTLLTLGWTANAESDADSWPRKFTANGSQFTIYQPQVESWKGNRLSERAAVAIQSQAAAEPTFGVLWLEARTDTDKSERAVALEDMQITRVNFPGDASESAKIKDLLQQNAPSVLTTVSLDRLRASMAIAESENRHQKVEVSNDPPQILFRDSPTVLVLVDGAPIWHESGQPRLLRAINTRALILTNGAQNQFYLSVGGHWYYSSNLEGNWQVYSPTGDLARKLAAAREAIQSNTQAETLNSASDQAPAVVVSTKATELIQTLGAPKFEPISNTQLLYVTNSPDNVFLYTADQGYYVTLSGRWFRSNSIKGPWRFVPSDKLPADFAHIPEGHSKGEVLASVAGTPQAQEAAIANEIPQTATIDRQAAKLTVVYDGAPQFNAIEGTRLQYAVNTSTIVLREANGIYYAVENGVWFTAPGAEGPWTVATSVPEDVYSIPPKSPVYNATYVYVYGADPRYVYTGYLPGYLGSYVNPYGVVVFGTGYYYRPWVHGVWIGYPCTYGYGLAWGYGFGWTFRPMFYGAPVYHPWWGPWPHYWAQVHGPLYHQGFTVNHVNVYQSWHGAVIRPSIAHVYRAAPAVMVEHAPRNNVYADSKGSVYRKQDVGWEQYNARSWQKVPTAAGHPSPVVAPMLATHQLEREHSARERGEMTARRYAAPAAPLPHVVAPHRPPVHSR